jgi:hypothetical protein
MLSSLVPAFLKPVSVLCGLSSSAEKSVDLESQETTQSYVNRQGRKDKPAERAVSNANSNVSTDESTSSSRSHISCDEEICARMAQLGRDARKAGRHVLRGNKLVLS